MFNKSYLLIILFGLNCLVFSSCGSEDASPDEPKTETTDDKKEENDNTETSDPVSASMLNGIWKLDSVSTNLSTSDEATNSLFTLMTPMLGESLSEEELFIEFTDENNAVLKSNLEEEEGEKINFSFNEENQTIHLDAKAILMKVGNDENLDEDPMYQEIFSNPENTEAKTALIGENKISLTYNVKVILANGMDEEQLTFLSNFDNSDTEATSELTSQIQQLLGEEFEGEGLSETISIFLNNVNIDNVINEESTITIQLNFIKKQ
ncbi:hypothetical protein [Aureibacter tunicatorum]|uniref:Lipocalin-like domain-containing protein n=1 Tax=Aureibacter tunicatorum TaxID=866807 RepID=A0AAE4BR87_9BACT|nr:hypothetical protein [Aureibacter tunicatorum]MDR6238406.1 hypothetical protein [Aureibacter tunicatorum]BDD03438.1 hypothetical protein AUTU_09210 [Aureibacter tunicatorum]